MKKIKNQPTQNLTDAGIAHYRIKFEACCNAKFDPHK